MPCFFMASSIVDLRTLLAERFPQRVAPAAAVFPTRLAALDEITGGLPKSAITELITSTMSAGSASVIHALLVNAARQNEFLALIDGCDSFDPQSAGNGYLRHM